MTNYIGLIHKDPESDFGVTFPDFPGCVSAGDTLDEAKAMGTEALQGHARFMVDEGEALPQPSSLETIMADPDNVSGVAFLVSIEAPSKSVRVNVILDEKLLEVIAGANMNRSRFLAAAAWEKLKRDHVV
ncbi:type II toxin-antitoxin system HicB family antitoxin [Asaia sp. HN010]|uniref:type II toxin-antitoxin system HicB family antitoxin n=1 Tax=Asaia sp. HN010 TaxID=3081233 RepID=UPI00301875AE